MKLEVGMYVRNKYGIAKIVNVKDNGICDVIIFDKNICFACDNEIKEEISNISLSNILPITKYIDVNKINASHNIIDLIQKGDYVNGLRIDKIVMKSKNELCFTYIYANEKYDVYTLKIEDIKSIVTKEQFENVKYKIGE